MMRSWLGLLSPVAALYVRHPLRWTALFSMAVFFALYAATAAPGIVAFFDDTLEFQTVAPTFAIAHPTGYPLYTLTGGLWTHLLPIGTWAGRMNLFSALHGAVTVGLVAALAAQLSPGRNGAFNPWAGLAAAVVFGLGPVWWGQTTVAEVYALHNALVAALLLTTLGVHRTLGADGQPTPAFDRRMTLPALLFGLGLAHHRTTLLLAPPLLLYLWASVPGFLRPRRVWGRWGLALVGPLLLYLYLPIVAALGARDLHGSYRNSWQGFWDHVLARGYTTFFADNPLAASWQLSDWTGFFVAQMGLPALIATLLGLARMVYPREQSTQAAWVILGVLALTVAFTALYRVPDPEVFLLPGLLCLALLAGSGVGLIGRLTAGPRGHALSALCLLLLVIVPGGRAQPTRHTDNWHMHDLARLMAAANFPPGSRVLGIEGEITALRYMQVAEGRAPGVHLIAADDPAQRLARLEETVAAGYPVYLTRELEGIGPRYSFAGEGALVRVLPRGTPITPLKASAGPPLTVTEAIALTAYHIQRTDFTVKPYIELLLDWRVTAPTAQVLKLSLRLLDADGTPVRDAAGLPVMEDRFPLHQVAWTSEWPLDATVRDVHYVALPPHIPPAGPLRLLVIVYDAADAQELARIEIMF